jgi:Spy/CpxP family protein refolding chaperone
MQALRTILAAVLVLVAVPAAAQDPQPAPQPGMRQNEMLFKDITLTPEQKAKVDSIQTAYRTTMRTEMQAGGGMQDSTARAKMMEMRKQHYANLRAVLTPEQQVVFDRNVAAMPPMGETRRPPPR